MSISDNFSVLFITVPSQEEGERFAEELVREKLAACVNLIPGIKSFYWWEGKIENAPEVLLVVKTLSEKLDSLTKWVKAHHSYTVPEVISMKIEQGNPSYLQWIKESVE